MNESDHDEQRRRERRFHLDQVESLDITIALDLAAPIQPLFFEKQINLIQF